MPTFPLRLLPIDNLLSDPLADPPPGAAPGPTLLRIAPQARLHDIRVTAGAGPGDWTAGVLAGDVMRDEAVRWRAGSLVRRDHWLEMIAPDGACRPVRLLSIGGAVAGLALNGGLPGPGTRLRRLPAGRPPAPAPDAPDAPQPGRPAIGCLPETSIATATGDRPVAALVPGDMVLTRDAGFQPLRHMLHQVLSPEDLAILPGLLPIRIAPGALGTVSPRRVLRLAPHQRVMLRARPAIRLFGRAEVLVAARQLDALPGVTVEDPPGEPLCYFQPIFEAAQVIYCNGAPALAPMAVGAAPPAPAPARDPADEHVPRSRSRPSGTG
ncbi:Hint domain-containing protein [Marinibacterium sp. SX1]|uniref:Hint domain-containing protein n=1 Tax=Marinibacterium sp. SX1 TaxID=3388424 RepID=UPI003D180402